MSPSSNTLLLMSYNSELVRLYRALFHTSAFLKEVLAFQMQDILFLESNSTISLACKISVCVFFSLWSSSHMQISLHCMALWWPTTDPTSTNNTFKEQLKETPPPPPHSWPHQRHSSLNVYMSYELALLLPLLMNFNFSLWVKQLLYALLSKLIV